MEEKIQHNVLLKDHTTFRIGGPAKYFFIAKTKEEIVEAIKWAGENDTPFFILGGGSKLLVQDNGFDGLVIKVQSSKFKFQGDTIFADAGVRLNQLIEECRKKGLSGLEWAFGIPGITLGGAIRGAAGAFNKSIFDIVKTVEVLDASQLKIKALTKEQCRFDYRETVFKKNKNLIVLSAVLVLKKKNKKEIEKEMRDNRNYRKEHHPALPSAGSIFKNPSPEMPAAQLIAQAGLKGKRRGGAEVSSKHPNFIVNLGKASSGDVVELIKLLKAKVKEKFNIVLEEELQYLGF